jgi:signal transduction histidine kinase
VLLVREAREIRGTDAWVVRAVLWASDEEIRVEVSDDGVGFCS